MLLAGLLMSCSAGKNDLSRLGLKGNIKEIREVQHEAVHRDEHWTPGKPLYNQRLIRYDRQGWYSGSVLLSLSDDTLGVTTVRRDGDEMVEEIYRSRIDDRSSRTIMDRISEEQVNYEVWEYENQHIEGANFYDSRGQMIRQVRVQGDREESSYFVYEKGKLVESYQENSNGTRTNTQLYEYVEFDSHGNWTTRLIYLEKDRIVPELVTVREISYY